MQQQENEHNSDKGGEINPGEAQGKPAQGLQQVPSGGPDELPQWIAPYIDVTGEQMQQQEYREQVLKREAQRNADEQPLPG